MAGVRKHVELVTNVAILVVCVLIGWSVITHKGLHFGQDEAGLEEAHLIGQTLPAPAGYHWADHQKTLVLAIRKGCHFCESSLPFYKRLGDLEKSNTLHAHVVAVMPDDPTDGATVLNSAGIAVEGVFGQRLDSMQVSGTPTLLLLDASGRVKHAWLGLLTPEQENAMIAAVEK